MYINFKYLQNPKLHSKTLKMYLRHCLDEEEICGYGDWLPSATMTSYYVIQNYIINKKLSRHCDTSMDVLLNYDAQSQYNCLHLHTYGITTIKI